MSNPKARAVDFKHVQVYLQNSLIKFCIYFTFYLHKAANLLLKTEVNFISKGSCLI